MKRWKVVAVPREEFGEPAVRAADACNETLSRDGYVLRRSAVSFARYLGRDGWLGTILGFEVVRWR